MIPKRGKKSGHKVGITEHRFTETVSAACGLPPHVVRDVLDEYFNQVYNALTKGMTVNMTRLGVFYFYLKKARKYGVVRKTDTGRKRIEVMVPDHLKIKFFFHKRLDYEVRKLTEGYGKPLTVVNVRTELIPTIAQRYSLHRKPKKDPNGRRNWFIDDPRDHPTSQNCNTPATDQPTASDTPQNNQGSTPQS